MLIHESPELRGSSVVSSATTAAETVFDNEDILRQILLRLSIKPLLKFKSVSKRWRSLISSRSFSRHWSISHPLTTSGIFLRRRYPNFPIFDFVNLSTNTPRAPFESLDLTGQNHEFEILQSCNGLLLRSTSDKDYTLRDYYIHNPTTKEFAMIPYLQDEDGERDSTLTFGFNLAFDPLRSSSYEVVCVQDFDFTDNKFQIKIYSSETGLWRPYNDVFQATSFLDFEHGVYWNNAIHWLCDINCCFYFDLGEEKIYEMPMPPILDPWEKRGVQYFGDCGGHLCLIEMYDLEFDVCEMQDDHSGWFVKYHVDLQIFYAGYPQIVPDVHDLYVDFFPNFSVLAMIDQSDQVDEEPYLVLRVHGEEEEEEEVVRVNVKSGVFRKLGVIEKAEEVDAYLYIESLAYV